MDTHFLKDPCEESPLSLELSAARLALAEHAPPNEDDVDEDKDDLDEDDDEFEDDEDEDEDSGETESTDE